MPAYKPHPNTMRTELHKLELLLIRVSRDQPHSNAKERVRAQIDTIRCDLAYDEVKKTYPEEAVCQAALYARDWRNGETVPPPSEEWRKELSD